MREHPDGAIFLSLFKKRSSVICAAELLAEIGDCRARYPTRDTLAADAGQAAVAIESGKRKAASFRWACNKAPARRGLHAGGHYSPPQPLGAGPLCQRPRPRARPPPRDPHSRTRLVPDRMALLAGRRAVRPGPPPRPATAHHGHHPDPVGARRRPPRHPAHARRRGRHRREPARAKGNRRTVSHCTRRSRFQEAPRRPKQLTLTLTVSAARRRWGGRRVPFSAGRAAGRALILAVAHRAICVRGSPGGSGGCAPGPHAGSARRPADASDPAHPTFLTSGRPRCGDASSACWPRWPAACRARLIDARPCGHRSARCIAGRSTVQALKGGYADIGITSFMPIGGLCRVDVLGVRFSLAWRRLGG